MSAVDAYRKYEVWISNIYYLSFPLLSFEEPVFLLVNLWLICLHPSCNVIRLSGRGSTDTSLVL